VGDGGRSSACRTCVLAPGPQETTLDSLISGIHDGILIDGRGNYSIDQQRHNFQFGGDAFWEIKGGRRSGGE
jgi:TldD protein